MRDFQNAFDAALAGVDSTIVEVMGDPCAVHLRSTTWRRSSGGFDDPESLGFAGGGSVLKEAARHYLCGRIRCVPCGVVTR